MKVEAELETGKNGAMNIKVKWEMFKELDELCSYCPLCGSRIESGSISIIRENK